MDLRMLNQYEGIATPWQCDDPLPVWQWLREEPVVIIEENELPTWHSPEQIYQAALAMGAAHVRYPAVRWGMHFYGKSKALPKFFALPEDRDCYGDVSAYLKARGMKVMAYVHCGVVYRELEDIHPDWLARHADGSPWVWNGMHRMGCLSNDAFIDAECGAIQEVIKQYQPDSIYVDGPNWYCRDCHCDACKEKYYALYGETLPEVIQASDSSLLKYNRFRDLVHLGVMRRFHAITQAAGLPFLFNTHMEHNPLHRGGCMELSMGHSEGANTTEVHRGSRLWSILLSAKLGEATKRVSLAYCPPGPFESLRTHNFLETLITGIGYAMHGGSLMLEPGVCYFHDDSGSPVMRQLTDTIRTHHDLFYRTQPVKELCLVLNNKTMDTLDAGAALDYVKASFQGAYEALTHAHRHFDCMFAAQLRFERIKAYRALFLPIATVLDEAEAHALRQYVEAGGTLLLGPRTSLYDEWGNRQPNFLLADLMGVDFGHENDKRTIHMREYRESAGIHPFSQVPEAYIRLEKDLPGMKADETKPIITTDAVVGDTPHRVVDYFVTHPREGTEVLATLFLPAGGAYGTPFDFPEGAPPAITSRRVGKGRVIYFASQPWERYLHRGLREQRALICAVVDEALDNRPVLRCEGPAGVLCNLVEDARGRYLHILNYCGTMLERSAAVEDIVPLHKLVFHVRKDRPFAQIDAVFDDGNVAVADKGDAYTITLDVLNVHQTIRMLY